MAKFYTGTATIDRRLQIVRADEQFYEYIGFDNYASIAGNVHPDELPRLKKEAAKLGTDETTELVVRMMTLDGDYHHVLMRLRGLSLKDERESYIEISIQDVQELEEKLTGICDENQIFSELLDVWGEDIFIYDVRKDYLDIFSGGNTSRINLFQGTLHEFQENVIRRNVVEGKDAVTFEEFCNDLAHGTKSFEFQLLFRNKGINPKSVIHYVKGRTIANSRKEPVVLGYIQQRDNAAGGGYAHIQNDYERDITTGLLTKKAILEYTEHLLSSKPKYNVNLCIVDLDNFKTINDTLGHMFGDEVLAKVADILKEAVVGKGVAGRIGGDEMFVVLEGINTLSDLRGVLRSIRNNVEWAYKDRKEVPQLSCSIGVSTYPDDALVYDDLFKIADKMLYRAKEKGKNRYIIYAPDVHGDVLSEGEPVNLQAEVTQRQDKEELVLKMLELAALQMKRPFEMILQDVGMTFGLDEIHLFYGDAPKALLESFWSANGREKPENSFGKYVHEENFEHLYREHNMAVIDKLDLIEQLCPQTHKYMMSRGIKVALVYRMSCRRHEGFIVYCKMSDISRKWSDSDMANLTYISKTIELIINDK